MASRVTFNPADAQVALQKPLKKHRIKDVFFQTTIKINSVFQKILEIFQKIYDFIYAKNPVTNKREFWFIPAPLEKFAGYWMYPSYVFDEGGKTFDEKNKVVVETVGRDLSHYAERDFKWEFTQIRSPKINAFCLPGGKIAIYDGMIEGIEKVDIKGYKDVTKEDKIAAVLAHEIIHADARHSAKKIERLFLLNIILIGLREYSSIVMNCRANEKEENRNEGINFIANLLMNLSVKLFLLAGSRSHEYEADRYGMHLMKKAGYNPKAALWLQEFFISREIERAPWMNKLFQFFSTHPTARSRLEKNQQTLEEIEKKDLAHINSFVSKHFN